jgi:putative ABC transport system ATP-binding protein
MIKALSVSRVFTSGEVSTQALAPTNLTISRGEFVAITGPSGAGKSTLLYQLGLLDTPSSGTVEIDGVDTSKLSDDARGELRRNKLGYVFQDYSLLPELTAEENVMLLLFTQKFSKETARARARAVLDRLGLGHRFTNFPSQLSGGEQQRVSIARAIAHNPLVLFADEPTANLDSHTGEQVFSYLMELNRGGQTIVMVTHEPKYSSRVPRIISLEDGVVVKDTKP